MMYYCIKHIVQMVLNLLYDGVAAIFLLRLQERNENMAWNLDSDRPIYAQIVEKLQMQIVSGYYRPGDKLPSVRDLATQACVNPNTMQKAFSELERSGLILTQRTSGRFVTEDIDMIKQVQNTLAKEQIKEFMEKMRELGFDREEIIKLLEALTKGDL